MDLNLTEPTFDVQWLTEKLFPLHRSLAGEPNRSTLNIIKSVLPELKILGFPSGKKVFDWKIPKEWWVKSATVKTIDGTTVVDLAQNNLHLVAYSRSFKGQISFDVLKRHLHYDQDNPKRIPYVTSYYGNTWGFCMSYEAFKELDENISYVIDIDAGFRPGIMNYGEVYIEGEQKQEILLSTYICHPSMANNEVSGMVALTGLLDILKRNRHQYSIRALFIPETIGSIAYIHQHLQRLKERVVGGFVLTCIGDERCYSYLKTPSGDRPSDKAALAVLESIESKKKIFDFLERGSDERQYNSPGVDLGIGVLSRSKFDEYAEYHSSDDDLSVISKRGLLGGISFAKSAFFHLDRMIIPKSKLTCEPKLSSRNLYPTTSRTGAHLSSQKYLDFLAFADGKNTLKEITDLAGFQSDEAAELFRKLKEVGLLE